MGDIADWMIEQALDEGMWYDSRLESPSSVTCRLCGRTGLYWKWRDGRYQLYLGAAPHRCKPEDVHNNVVDEFDALD